MNFPASNQGEYQEIRPTRGLEYRLPRTLVDDSGNTVDAANITFDVQVRTSYESSGIASAYVQKLGGGDIDIVFTAVQTASLTADEYVWTARGTSPGAEPREFYRGPVRPKW